MKSYLKILGLVVLLPLLVATTFKSENNRWFEIAKNIEIYTNLYKELNTYYVDDIDPGQLMRTGIDA
ncbi:MAG: S41 family peptidase, partial [Bacteroidota bacterium]